MYDVEKAVQTVNEACVGVLGIQNISHFTSRDIGYYPFYFQGYGILCSIFWLLSGILNIKKNIKYWLSLLTSLLQRDSVAQE